MKKDLGKMRRLLAVLLAALLVCVSLSAVFAENVEHVHTYDQGKTETIVDDENPSYESCGSQGHQEVFDTYTYPVCDTCGERGSTSDHGTQRGEILSHTFQDGVCVECGYACSHSKTTSWLQLDMSSQVDVEEIPEDDVCHMSRSKYFLVTVCTQCQSRISRVDGGYGDFMEQDHSYDWISQTGVCELCGHVCSHPDIVTDSFWKDSDEVQAEAIDAETHRVAGTRVTYRYCDICDKEFERSEETVAGVEPHEFHNDGTCTVCELCGYVKCENHQREVVDDLFPEPFWAGGEGFDTGSDETHVFEGDRARWSVCKVCGEEYQDSVFDTVIEKHCYTHTESGYICTYCGHVCTHSKLENGVCVYCGEKVAEPEPTPTPTPEPTPTPTPEPDPEPEATPTPTPAPDPEPEATPTPTPAPDPANDPTPTPTPDPEPEPEPENDPTPTPKPKATLEPMPTLEPVVPLELVYEPVDEDTEVSGVKASDKLPMEEALAIVGESLDAEEVTVEIPGIEKVLNEEEMAKFNQLTVQERLMVALNALGFGDILKTAMTQEEKDALMQLLAEQFAKETIVIDGEEYTCFCIDLVITRDGEKTYQRYAFRQDDEGKWILCQIDIGEYKPVEN